MTRYRARQNKACAMVSSGRGNSRGTAQLTRSFLLAAAVLTLVLGGAASASAQGVHFQTTSLSRQVRSVGTTETVGEVVLTAISPGTVKSGSTISVNYGVAVEAGTGVVNCSAAACALGVNITVGVAGSVLTITFVTDVAFSGGDVIAISQIRLDASSSFGNISAFLSAVSSAPGTNPITFTNTFLTVALPISPPTSVQLTSASPLSVCSPSEKIFSVKVTEAFPGAYTTAAQESAFSNVGDPGVDPMGAGELDTTLRLAFTNIPEDVTITFTGFGGSGTLTPATSFTSFTATSGSQSVTVDVALTATSITTVENVIVNFTASATAFSPGTGSVSVSLRGGDAAPNVPRFAANVQGSGNVIFVIGPTSFAVVNGASFLIRAVAPGSQATLFGNCLATGTASAVSLPLPTALGGTSVTFNAIAVPLFFVFSGQINLQVPWELAGETEASVVVDVNGVTGDPLIVQLAPTDPGIFAIHNQNITLNSASNPAMPGSVIQIFATGLGAVTNQPASGAAAPSNPVAVTTSPPTVTIDGMPAAVLFSGLSPGFVALYQVNVLVPDSASGGALSLVLTIGGLDSNTVTVHIARRKRGQITSE